MRQLLRNRRVRVGVGILVFFLLVAFVGPLILSAMHRSAEAIDYNALGVSPSGKHPFGTTDSGQDVLSQLVFGARGSIVTGFLVAVFVTIFATFMGLVGAYLGGIVDTLMNGLSNVALTVSGFPLLIVIAAYVPHVGLIGIAFVISIVSWAAGARGIRAQALSLRSREYVVAMRMAGESRPRLIVFEVMPHLFPVMSSLFIGCFTGGIAAQAGLAFLGLGGSTVSWGTMIGQVQSAGAISQGQWWWFLPPGLSIVLVGCAVVLINFGIDEISDPRLRSVDPRIMARALRAIKQGTTGQPTEPKSLATKAGAR